MPDTRPTSIPAEVLQAWDFEAARIKTVDSGLINRTWKISLQGRSYALQWLNPIFGPECIEDLDLITRSLAAASILTPLLHSSLEGQKFIHCRSGIWRCLSWIDGESFDVAETTGRCREAGRILGVFHGVFWNSSIRLSDARSPVHDLRRHRNALEHSLECHREHRNFKVIQQTAREILQWPDPLPEWGKLPKRVVHGDPKISNILFDHKGRAVCIVDLDTPCRAALADELGDALRSWCHPGREDEIASLSLERFDAAMEGWFEGIGDQQPEVDEVLAVAAGVERISLELAARFAADALAESYFGWDESRYLSASDHNLARAEAQFFLARSVAEERSRLRESLRFLLQEQKG